jgi:hypothetical protein
MNCPSRTDDVDGREGWNQNPNLLSGTTREDFNGRTNARMLRRLDPDGLNDDSAISHDPDAQPPSDREANRSKLVDIKQPSIGHVSQSPHNFEGPDFPSGPPRRLTTFYQKTLRILVTFGQFVGPGFMVRTPVKFQAHSTSEDREVIHSHQFNCSYFIDICSIY